MLPIFQTYLSILRFMLSEFVSFAYFVVKKSGWPSPVFPDLSVFVLFELFVGK